MDEDSKLEALNEAGVTLYRHATMGQWVMRWSDMKGQTVNLLLPGSGTRKKAIQQAYDHVTWLDRWNDAHGAGEPDMESRRVFEVS